MDAPAKLPETPALEMTAVSVGSRRDPGSPALDDVNWSVRAGEYWVLGGMHGSGKTDFLAMTDGLAPPLQGSYRLFGREMPATGDQFLSERLRIGLVFDGGQLFHHLTLEENVALPLRYHRDPAAGDPGQIVKTILEATGLSPWAGRLPGTVGRAWQKRAGLARALVLRPEVLLLDNPTGGLDSRHLQWWLDALDQLSAGHGLMEGRPMTLVVAAEDLRPWRNRAAHFAVLQKRRFFPLGHHAQLAGLAHPLVQELLAEPRGAAG
jgi:ABC-type transporter Mla maintaining outer membrane lipid asymmetry ATPase subunit MlaF